MTCVYLYAPDEILRAGLAAQLTGADDMVVAPPTNATVDADVAVVAADDVDEPTLRTVRALPHRGCARVLLLLAKVDERAVLAGVEAGACGILRRSGLTRGALVDAVRSAHAGGGTLPPDMLGLLLAQVGVMQRHELRGVPMAYGRLADRELQVLRLVADGYATAEIAQRLSYSERTVKNVIQQVVTRLQLRNRSHAVAYAVREGLI
ncbi:MAG TPA: response regulator transcription factor [Frankiaceae bacterium]|nr:response regulator transcription factor [Frankiaceae bacterium]